MGANRKKRNPAKGMNAVVVEKERDKARRAKKEAKKAASAKSKGTGTAK